MSDLIDTYMKATETKDRTGYILVLTPCEVLARRQQAFQKVYPTFRVETMPHVTAAARDRHKLDDFCWNLHYVALLSRDPVYLFWRSSHNDRRGPAFAWTALATASEAYAEDNDGVFRCIKYRGGDHQEQPPLLFL